METSLRQHSTQHSTSLFGSQSLRPLEGVFATELIEQGRYCYIVANHLRLYQQGMLSKDEALEALAIAQAAQIQHLTNEVTRAYRQGMQPMTPPLQGTHNTQG